MSNFANFINISALPVLSEISPGDYFVVKTPEGDALIDYTDLPFVPISAGNITVSTAISASNFVASTTVSAASAFFQRVFVNGVSGINVSGSYNTFTIQSGLVISATNTESVYITQLSGSIDTKIDAVSAAVPKIFADGGVLVIDGGPSSPAYSLVCVGNNEVPNNVFISPSDIKVHYLWNQQLEEFFAGVNPLSSLPVIFVEENTANNYLNSNRKVQFRVTFRPPIYKPARIAWSVLKSY
jgi:hypothetical protein